MHYSEKNLCCVNEGIMPSAISKNIVTIEFNTVEPINNFMNCHKVENNSLMITYVLTIKYKNKYRRVLE